MARNSAQHSRATASKRDEVTNRMLYDRYYLGAEATALAAVVIVTTMAVLFWNQSDRTGLVIWLGLMAVAIPVPPLMKRRQLPFDTWLRIVPRWEVGEGFAWGSIALFAMPADAVWQATLGGIIAAVVLAGSTTSSQFARAHIAFTGTLTACAIAGFAINAVGQARWFMWMLLVGFAYGASIAFEQRKMHVSLVESLHHNDELIATLAEAHQKTKVANARLADAAAIADRLARTDPLTGLANRMGFDEALDYRLASLDRSTPASTLVLAFIDLNGFKAINDTFGHGSGDRVLKAVAERLVSAACSGDLVARIGGDEFVILSDGDCAHDLGERVTRSFEQPVALGPRMIIVRASTGVYTATPGLDRDTVMRRVDAAQYRAKRSGEGYAVHNDDPQPPASEAAAPRPAIPQDVDQGL